MLLEERAVARASGWRKASASRHRQDINTSSSVGRDHAAQSG
jgi:hypothetical protein